MLPNPGIRYENLGSYYKTEFDLYLDHKIHTVYVEISVSISPTGNYFLNNIFIF
jgi:hypothetical protein